MYADGYIVGDGSWDLKVYVTDLKVERILRVKGDLHIGGVMFKLVEDLGMCCLLAFSSSRRALVICLPFSLECIDNFLWQLLILSNLDLLTLYLVYLHFAK